MNKALVNDDTGEIVARSVSFYPTMYSYLPPKGEIVEGESQTDTSLYQPLKEVVERCERAGMLRQLLDGANSMHFDSEKPIEDSVLDGMSFYTGDVFSDVNIGTDAFMDALQVSLDGSGTPLPDKSDAPTTAQEKAVSDDEEQENN